MKESAITGNSSTHLAGVHAHAIRPVADHGDEDRHERGVVQEAGEEHRRHHEAQDGDADASGCFFNSSLLGGRIKIFNRFSSLNFDNC